MSVQTLRLALHDLALVIRVSVLLPPDRRSALFTWEIYFLLLGDRKEGQNVPLALDVSLVTLVKNNQYAIVVYLEAAHTKTHEFSKYKIFLLYILIICAWYTYKCIVWCNDLIMYICIYICLLYTYICIWWINTWTHACTYMPQIQTPILPQISDSFYCYPLTLPEHNNISGTFPYVYKNIYIYYCVYHWQYFL